MFYDDKPLFVEHLSDWAYQRVAQATAEARRVTETQLRETPLNELVARHTEKWLVTPITLHEDRQRATSESRSLDARNYRESLFIGRGEPRTVPGTRITIHVPFDGTSDLFFLRPSQSNLNPPRGQVSEKPKEFLFSVDLPKFKEGDADELLKRRIGQTMAGVRQNFENQAREIDALNLRIQTAVRELLESRSGSLNVIASSLAALGIQVRGGSPSLPVHLDRTIIPRSSATVVQPGAASRTLDRHITDRDYEDILSLIRHQCRTFEGAPGAFRKLGEERLRDVIRASLNAVYSASGEAFRKKGKTDMCIEAQARSAFVAECKCWGTHKALLKAIDQLLGYSTWRDTKTALVVFNKKNRDFAALRAKVMGILAEHPAYRRTLREDPDNAEWRVVFEGDSGDHLVCHVMMYHLAP